MYFSAILFLDDEVKLATEEINFGFKVWTNFQDSIVGFKTAVRFNRTVSVASTFLLKSYIENENVLKYNNQKSSEYSIVDFSAAWISRFYLNQFTQQKQLRQIVNSKKDCESIGKELIADILSSEDNTSVTGVI